MVASTEQASRACLLLRLALGIPATELFCPCLWIIESLVKVVEWPVAQQLYVWLCFCLFFGFARPVVTAPQGIHEKQAVLAGWADCYSSPRPSQGLSAVFKDVFVRNRPEGGGGGEKKEEKKGSQQDGRDGPVGSVRLKSSGMGDAKSRMGCLQGT